MKYTEQIFLQAASQCLLCYDPPCDKVCPSKAMPARFLRSLRFANPTDAVLSVSEKSLCTYCRDDQHIPPCERVCIRAKIDRPVEIRKVHRLLGSEEVIESYNGKNQVL
ncbi:MAG: hypothetical protein PUB21_08630 [Bacteroidales bacterium]|nr:hypothetical protein [Bacteroidales bacterium]